MELYRLRRFLRKYWGGAIALSFLMVTPLNTQATASELPHLSGVVLSNLEKTENQPGAFGHDPAQSRRPAQSCPPPLAQRLDEERLELEPAIIEDSPVLQRWLEASPDVLEDMRRDPAFRTRLRVSYAEVDDESGFQISVDDIFLGETGLALNADYARADGGDRQSWGVNLRYYTLPLGHRVNIAPVVGYRELNTPDDEVDGAELGLRLLLVPSRTGASDVSVTQSWVNPGSDRQEASLTTFTAGYALTRDLRLSSDIQIQVTGDRQDTWFGVGLEWML